MSVYILTSMFPNGFPEEVAKHLNRIIRKRGKFVFVASEFEKAHEKTDRYFAFFLNMFKSCGIVFDNACVVDARMTEEQMQGEIEAADVVWLAGGNTPGQYQSFEKYGLVPILREHKGVIIGMSAGAINMAKISVCSATCGAIQKEIYNGLGLVDISVEPHFDKRGASDELVQISMDYPLYGLCDDSMIIFENGNMALIGDVFLIERGVVTKLNGGFFMIESERLVFRKIEDSDFKIIAEIMRDEGVKKVWEHYFSDEDVREWINKRKKSYETNGIDYLLAIRKDSGAAVGQIGLLKENINGEEVWGIGYILMSEHYGNGYATEGAKAMADYAFHTLNADKIICDIRPMNQASIAVAKRIDMVQTGEFIKNCNGVEMPHLIFELNSDRI